MLKKNKIKSKINSKKRCCPAVVQAVSSPPVFTLWTFPNFTLQPLPVLPCPISHPPCTPPSAACCGDEMGRPAASAVAPQVFAPAGFNIYWSTSQRIAQFSVLFFFSFFSLLILFKFDAVSVLVWYTLYKYMNMNINFCCPEVCCNTSSHTCTYRFLYDIQ